MTFFSVAAALPLEAATATWNRNPEPAVTGYRLSYGTESGIHTTFIDVGNVVTYNFFPPAGQRYFVVVQAIDANGLSGKSAEVILDLSTTQPPPNQRPVLAQPVNMTSVQNTTVSLTLMATDPEGNSITYGATGLPPGLSINPTTGVIAGTVTTVGTYTVVASASDTAPGITRTFTWTVSASGGGGTTTIALSPTDTTIELQNQSASTQARLSAYTYPANQVGRAILMKFDLAQIPANATIQSATLQLTLIGTDNVTAEPSYAVTLHRITNIPADPATATGYTASPGRMWTAVNCCMNNIPMAQADITPAQATTNVDRALGVKTWDALSLVQAWRTTPATNYGLLLNADRTKAADRYRDFASMENATVANRPSLRITYSVAGGGTGGGDTTAPTVALSAPNNNASVSGASVTVSATASDAVGVVGVQFKVDGVNIGAEDTTSPYSIAWNSTTIANGSHQLTAVARDAAGNSTTSAARTVTVTNTTANRAPVLTQPANQTSAEGSAVSVTLSASDPDGNALTYSATGLPSGLGINATTGVISGTPSYASAGTTTVTATASDGTLSHSRTFTWTITNTNRPPVLTQPANQTNASGTTVSLQLSATDPDGTTPTYQATGLPGGLSINTTTGRISGTLSASSAGVHTVTATASDGALTATRTFTWSVDSGDKPVTGDFDGDGRSDPATFRKTTGEWRVWRSGSNYAAAAPIVWGVASDEPMPADYDGDRRTDIAVYRPSTGTWHILLSTTNMQSSLEVQWGNATDTPLALDYDRDGRADLALPRFGGFEILLSGSNYTNSVTVR